jgi:hypothetical protein
MSVRNCQELGLSLQKIIGRLLENDDLIKLLYYEDKDPLSKVALDKDTKQEEIFEKLIKIVPHVGTNEDSKSRVVVYITKAGKHPRNDEFKNIEIHISVFVPLTNWIIKDTNLRPFAILGQLQSSLDGKVINGLGRLGGGDFELKLLTEEMSCYEQIYTLTEYD